jgi:hypothetical protein
MTKTIALPIDAPATSAVDVRTFRASATGYLVETGVITFNEHDLYAVRMYYTSYSTGGGHPWKWADFLFFPEAWPPDVLSHYVEYGAIQQSWVF